VKDMKRRVVIFSFTCLCPLPLVFINSLQ